MSDENAVSVGAVRRAFSQLSDPAPALLADLAGPEESAAELEPDLPLLDVDLFGGLTLPVRAARIQEQRGSRRAPTPLERLAAAAREAPAPAPTAAGPQDSRGRAAEGAGRRRIEAAPAAEAAAVAPVFPLAGAGTPPAPPAGEEAAAGTRRTSAATSAAGGGTPPPFAAAASPEAEARSRPAPPAAAGGSLALIAQLTESILAATARAADASGATGTGRARAAPPGRSPAAESDFLVETVRSLGGETAAAFGLEPGAPGPRPEVDGGEPAGGVAAPPAVGTPAPKEPLPAEPAAARAPAGPAVGVPPRSDEGESDPATLAALVNDALVEQARRHGLELG